MDSTSSFRFFNRGPSPTARLVFFALLSLLLLFIDARYQYLESTRRVISIIVQPLQRLTTMPGVIWHEVTSYFETQSNLTSDNTQLRQQHTIDAAQLLQLQVLQAENEHLRKLLDVQQNSSYPMQLAEIVYIERDIFTRKVFVNKGSDSNVKSGQVVMDAYRRQSVFSVAGEVTLITDKDHAVPTQVLRTGLRAVVFGSGDISNLALRYMPISADIQPGDVLVTSGLDGTYPPGLPVAKVIKIERDAAYPFARIVCSPIAGVDQQRRCDCFRPAQTARPPKVQALPRQTQNSSGEYRECQFPGSEPCWSPALYLVEPAGCPPAELDAAALWLAFRWILSLVLSAGAHKPYRRHRYRWAVGIFADVADASLFGQHALSYTVLAFGGILLHRRVQMFDVREQSMQVFPLLLISYAVYALVHWQLRGYVAWEYFLGAFTSALLWAPMTALLQALRRPRSDPNEL
jgi:rod shape-determining protein MreC